MEHVVFFPAPDGTPAFRRLADLDEAGRLGEHLRNVEGVYTVSVHALAEVPLAFRAYYRVEVPASHPEAADMTYAGPAQAQPPAQVEPPAQAQPLQVEPVPALAVPTLPVEPVLVEPVQVEAVQFEPFLVESFQVEPAQVDHAPALALVAEPVEQVEEPEDAPEDAPEPALAASNGHATPASLGFFT